MLTNLRQDAPVQVPWPLPQAADREPAAVRMTDWRQRMPVLSNGAISLRELRMSDAEALLDMLSTEEVSRFISPPPTSVDGFERFIAWAQRERAAGRYICFAVVPDGMDTAIGIFQVRQLDPTFSTAEWGFAHWPRFLGHRSLHRRGATDHRLCLRRCRCAPARSASGHGQRARQRGAGEDWRRQGSGASTQLPAQRTALRPGALVDRPRRLAAR